MLEGFVDFAYIQPIILFKEKSLSKLNISSDNQLIIEELIASMRNELLTKNDGYRLSVKADLL